MIVEDERTFRSLLSIDAISDAVKFVVVSNLGGTFEIIWGTPGETHSDIVRNRKLKLNEVLICGGGLAYLATKVVWGKSASYDHYDTAIVDSLLPDWHIVPSEWF